MSKIKNQQGIAQILVLAAIVVLGVVLFKTVFSLSHDTYLAYLYSNPLSHLYSKNTVEATSTMPASMPLISRGKPVFASTGVASYANDNDYSTYWGGAASSWLAYNLSSVPAANRSQIVAAWYNDPITTDYWQGGGIGNSYYNLVKDYVIEANPAPGGSTAPTTGWVALTSVTGNNFTGRMHRLDLTGHNWIRIRTTATQSGPPYLQFDIHDASLGVEDSYLFLGDSITAEGAAHSNISGLAWKNGNLSQMIEASSSGTYFPSIIAAGTGGVNSAWALTYFDSLIGPFSGRFVTLNYGTNDANNSGALSQAQIQSYYNNMLGMVDKVESRGMVAIVPHIPWGCASGGWLGTNAKTLNDYMDAHLFVDRPNVIKGPDFWAFFNANRTLLTDCIHPTYTSAAGKLSGYEHWQILWRDTLMANVYGGNPLPSPSPSPSATTSPSPSESPSPTPSPSPSPSPTPTPTPSPSATPLPVGNGLLGNYFNNKTLSDPVVISRIDPRVNFNWSSGSPGTGIATNNFSARWTGFVMPRYSEDYTFCVASNDGTRLWVNDILIVDFWFNQSSAIQHCGTIALQANTKFPIKLEFYENTGNAVERLYWQSATQLKQIVPTAKLFSN